MSDATQKCPVCGAILPARARFCGDCGTAIRPAAAAPTPHPGAAASQVLPWFVAGCCVLAIHATVIIVALRGGRSATETAPTAAPGAPFASASPGTGRPTDISGMTPREAADRLYERIARASESGDTSQVQFFAPMALNAYANVTPLDADARLHIGLIDLATGDAPAAAAQADSITRLAGLHLFGPLLKARAAEAQGNRAVAREAYRAFLANYNTEKRRNLPEYQQHDALLTETRTAAQRATGR